jgi:hypothetical protein
VLQYVPIGRAASYSSCTHNATRAQGSPVESRNTPKSVRVSPLTCTMSAGELINLYSQNGLGTGGNVALVRLEVGITIKGRDESRYPIYLAFGDKRMEIADFRSVATCQHYIRLAYRRFAVPEPEFAPEPERLVAPWFEV